MNTEMLTYSRSKGVFAGLTVEGAVVEQDNGSTHAIYGRHMMFRNMLSGKATTPRSADAFLKAVSEAGQQAKMHNAQNCVNGWERCDHSKLTPQQAKQTADSEHQSNHSACKDGVETCDYAKLTATEAKTLADTEHKRNYGACLKGYGYCDASRLTVEEARTIDPHN